MKVQIMGGTGEAYDFRSFLSFILIIIYVQFVVIRVKIIIAELLLNLHTPQVQVRSAKGQVSQTLTP